VKNLKTIKVSDETHRRLLKITGSLQAREGRRKSIEESLLFLLDEYEREII